MDVLPVAERDALLGDGTRLERQQLDQAGVAGKGPHHGGVGEPGLDRGVSAERAVWVIEGVAGEVVGRERHELLHAEDLDVTPRLVQVRAEVGAVYRSGQPVQEPLLQRATEPLDAALEVRA